MRRIPDGDEAEAEAEIKAEAEAKVKTVSTSTSTLTFCRHAATAPHGCGLVAVQVIRNAQGAPIGRYVCTFCPEQAHVGSHP